MVKGSHRASVTCVTNVTPLVTAKRPGDRDRDRDILGRSRRGPHNVSRCQARPLLGSTQTSRFGVTIRIR